MKAFLIGMFSLLAFSSLQASGPGWLFPPAGGLFPPFGGLQEELIESPPGCVILSGLSGGPSWEFPPGLRSGPGY